MTRIVRTVLTFVLLTAGYFGYERGYAILSTRVQPPFEIPKEGMDLKPSQSASLRRANELAMKSFGEHHWTSGTVSDVSRYYNDERGYWMYWSSLEFPEEQERKRIVLSPFAVIWASEKDGSTKVLTGDRAIIDFDQPFQPFGGGGKANVVHAKVEGIEEKVLILDDKGTPDPNDDLVVTAPYFEYFEKQSQLRCDDFVQMIDGDVSVDGKGLVISLRAAESSGGFPGAEVVTLNDVKILSEDIGGSGFVPGTATPDQQLADESGALKTPGILSAGTMRMQLPKPKLPAPVGPPAPTAPTIAEFSRNVVIERGSEAPDRITGDHLYAILVPKESTPPPLLEGEEAAEDEVELGSSGGLRLLEARVDGHVVWLESQSERLRVRGNELIYRKPDDATPEVSYFRADPGQQIEFERMEVDEQGNPTSFVTVLSADATLRGDPEGKGRSTVITRGPVLLEMRTRRDGPVERSASCRGEMIIETSLSAAEGEDDETRTFITLEGWPIMHDPGQMTLAAREKIEVSLMPQDDGMPVESTETGGRGRSYQIEWLSALGDVHMVTPEGVKGPSAMATADGKSAEGRRELNARERLDVVFSYLNEVIDPNAPLADSGAAQAEGAGRTRFASQVQAGGSTPEEPKPVAPENSSETTVAAAQPGSEEPSPPFSAEADVVWARIEVTGGGPGIDLTGGGGGTREVREARFRRNVVIHQDPAPGKDAGFHVDADYGVDLQNVGPGRLKLFAHGETRPVTIASDDVFIQGFPDPKADGKVVVGVDQAYDYAFIQGPGRLWNLSDSTGMGKLSLAGDRREEAPDKGREPLIVTWNEAMFFHGQFAEPDGSPGPARALFLGDVKSRNGDAGSSCQEMEAIFDRGVSFDRALPGASKEAGSGPSAEGKLEIASIICNGQVELWNIARDDSDETIPVADRQVLELRQAFGDSLTFDRIGDQFWMDGAGTVSVATLETANSKAASPANLGRGVIPTSYQPDAPQRAARPKLMKLRIDFNEGLEGQLGTVGGGYRVAEFRGDARAMRAGVGQFQDIVDFDRPPSDAVMLEGDVITVEQFPEMPGVPERNFMKAFGGAQARADGKTLLGDTITYDSTSDNFFVKGSASAPVTIASQEAFGQPTSRSTARSIRYNAKTEDVDFIDPGSGMFFRPESGYRLGNAQAPKEKEKPERKRPTGRLPNRNDLERQGFTGN